MGFNNDIEEELDKQLESDMAEQHASLYAGASFKFDQDDDMIFENTDLEQQQPFENHLLKMIQSH